MEWWMKVRGLDMGADDSYNIEETCSSRKYGDVKEHYTKWSLKSIENQPTKCVWGRNQVQ